MGLSLYKTGKLNSSSVVNITLRSSALVNFKNDHKYYFIGSFLASLHPYNINRHRVSKYKHYFNELNIQGFDFTNEFKCSDMHKFEKLNNLSINIFDFNFHQDQDK